MKITEAQLKRIIAEEVQIAIDEGLFDKISGAVKGAAGYLGGKAADVAKQGAQAVKKGIEATTAAAKAGAEQAEKESVVRQQRAAVEQASAIVNNLGRIFDKVGAAEGGKQQIMDMISTLAVNANIDLSELAKSVSSSQAAGKETLANAPRSPRGPEGAGQVGSRLGRFTAGTPGFNEAQAEAIAESIVRRITKKR
jgi:hypothetical protein